MIHNENEILEAIDNLKDILIKKGYGYGDSFSKLWHSEGSTAGTHEILKKVFRIQNMSSKGSTVEHNESLMDSWLDIAGTAILSLIECKKDACGQLTKEEALNMKEVEEKVCDTDDEVDFTKRYTELAKKLLTGSPVSIYKRMPAMNNGTPEGFRFGFCTGIANSSFNITGGGCEITFKNVRSTKDGTVLRDGTMKITYTYEQLKEMVVKNNLM